MKTSFLRRWSCAMLAALMSYGALAQTPALKAADGLWAYKVLQGGGKGEFIPLTGVILFKNGVIAQQSIYNGEPFEQQGAMAHAGTYAAGPMGIHMVTEQTISISPDKPKPLSFRADMPHDISAARSGDELVIVFDSGTVQKFSRIGPAKGDIYSLKNGVLAFVDGHFILVDGDENGAVSGYGKYRNTGTAYELDVIRWSEVKGSKAKNLKDTKLTATFDGKTFKLADGRAFNVIRPKK
ncbi:MAG: hypothetical protein ABI885_26050 [Gammaproteobacteria bacterium]